MWLLNNKNKKKNLGILKLLIFSPQTGLLIYLFYGYRHSKLRLANSDDGDVGYSVLQSDKSSEDFTGALYGTIVMQQPDSAGDNTSDSAAEHEQFVSDDTKFTKE